MAKAELLTKWSCPVCHELCNGEMEADSHCPKDEPTEMWVCSICDQAFPKGFKRVEREAREHLTDHERDEDGLLPEERYRKELVFTDRPVLGEWKARMDAETEFLIPNA